MFKKVLIISDNLLLCKKITQIISNNKSDLELINIAISPQSNIEEFKKEISKPINSLNLKCNEDVNHIINSFDLVFSIHCKQLFPKLLINSIKCINIHPGYNPINRGWFPQVFSIINDLPIGATIHEMDEELDNGKIIDRDLVNKEVYDTSLTLYNKIIKKEIELFEKNIDSIILNTYKSFKPENSGNIYLKKDFNNLLELDLEENLTMGECIDKLRALTHGDYSNAYFIDKENGKKVYISVNLKLQ